jgi:hypothetical protein
MGLLNPLQRCYLPWFAVSVLAKMCEVPVEIQCRDHIVAEVKILSERFVYELAKFVGNHDVASGRRFPLRSVEPIGSGSE